MWIYFNLHTALKKWIGYTQFFHSHFRFFLILWFVCALYESLEESMPVYVWFSCFDYSCCFSCNFYSLHWYKSICLAFGAIIIRCCRWTFGRSSIFILCAWKRCVFIPIYNNMGIGVSVSDRRMIITFIQCRYAWLNHTLIFKYAHETKIIHLKLTAVKKMEKKKEKTADKQKKCVKS